MNFSYNLPTVLIGAAVVVVQPQLAVALTLTEVSDIAKEFTVRIDGDGVGSGVIFEHKGDTYYVFTNRHVVYEDGRYEIQTPDGISYPVYYSQELPGLDLVVLEFKSNKNYRVADLGNSDQMREGMTVYVVGWADRLPGIDERSYQVTDGRIRSRLQKPNDGYALVYNNEAVPGMSGGPMLDENGRVVGINGKASPEVETGTVLRLGIPINTFKAARSNLRSPTATPPTAQQPGNRATTTAQKPSNRQTQTAARQPSAEDLISLGGSKANRGEYRAAIADYNQALRINPNNPDAYFQRGVANSDLKDYKAALEDFNQVLRLSPKNAFAYAYRGFIRTNLQDYQGAIADGDQVIRLEPNSSISGYGYAVRGAGRLGLGDKQGAIADLDQMIRQFSDRAEPYMLRGTARATLLGDKQGAIADFQKAADLFQQQGKRDDYQNALNKIRELQGTEVGAEQTSPSNQRDYQAEIAAADQAIRQNPNDSTAYFNRAVARYNQGDKQAALADLNQATRSNPRNSLAWHNRGFVLAQLGQNKEAIASYDRAIEANSAWGDISLANAYSNRAELRSDRGDYRGAIADFTEVIRLNPKNAVAYALRGLNYQRRGKNQEAIADFNQAARIDPNNALAYTVRGFTYHLQGDYQGALAAYEKALAQDAKLLPAVNNVGLIKYEFQDVEGAIRQWEAAIDIDSKSAEPQLALAVALYTKGDSQRSLAMAEAALRLDSRFADLEFLKKNLWGDRILADTQKLLKNPRLQKLLSHDKRV